MAMFSACENLQLQEPESPEEILVDDATEDQQFFVATIGADTKAYLEFDASRNVYKTVWDDDDEIFIIDPDTGESERCVIVEGAGTSTAKFAGKISADRYIAVYGQDVYYNGGKSVGLYLSSHQSLSSYPQGHMNNGCFPMIAESSTKSLSFKNICSVLKITVTGEEDGNYLNSMTISSNDSNIYMAGGLKVDISGSEPRMTFDYGSEELNCSVWEYLSSAPLEFFVVLPAQTYTGGFTIQFDTDYGTKTISVDGDVEMKRSRIRNLNVDLTSDPVYDVQQDWFVCLSEDDGDSWDNYQMYLEDGMYVWRGLYIDYSSYFRLYEYNSDTYYGCSSDFRNSWSKTNACVELASGEDWWWFGVPHTGYYDIYVDPDRNCTYIMSSGVSPYDLPTQDLVIYDSYDMMFANAGEGALVKVYGIVMAKNANGFILSIDTYYDNYVYVYDPYGYCPVDLGYALDLYALAKTYRGQKELELQSGTYWYYMYDTDYYYYDLENPTAIDPASYTSTSFDYVGITGYYTTNTSNGKTYYNITDESGNRIASITAPIEDLSSYVGLKVNLVGYYQGSNADGTAVIVMRQIATVPSGSTEEILPGGSITVN